MSLPIESVSFVVDSCFINSELDLWANTWIPLYSSREGKSFDLENREIHMKRICPILYQDGFLCLLHRVTTTLLTSLRT